VKRQCAARWATTTLSHDVRFLTVVRTYGVLHSPTLQKTCQAALPDHCCRSAIRPGWLFSDTPSCVPCVDSRGCPCCFARKSLATPDAVLGIDNGPKSNIKTARTGCYKIVPVLRRARSDGTMFKDFVSRKRENTKTRKMPAAGPCRRRFDLSCFRDLQRQEKYHPVGRCRQEHAEKSSPDRRIFAQNYCFRAVWTQPQSVAASH